MSPQTRSSLPGRRCYVSTGKFSHGSAGIHRATAVAEGRVAQRARGTQPLRPEVHPAESRYGPARMNVYVRGDNVTMRVDGNPGQASDDPQWRRSWTADRLVNSSGVLLAFGGAAFGLGTLMHPSGTHPPVVADLVDPSYAFWHVVAAIGLAAIGAALSGVIAFQVRASGSATTTDVIGYVLAATGAFAHAGLNYSDGLTLGAIAAVIPKVFDLNGELFGAPQLAGVSAFASTTFSLGLVALGGAGVLRAALPRSAFVALMIGGLLYGVPVQPASPLPWWIVEAGALAIGSAAILLGRWIWQGGPRPSRLPPLPREQSTPKGDEAQPS